MRKKLLGALVLVSIVLTIIRLVKRTGKQDVHDR